MIWNTVWLEKAGPEDAQTISELSRDEIELGLEWYWTESQILRAIRRMNTLVVKASIRTHFAGVGALDLYPEFVDLSLLATVPKWRRRGVAEKMVQDFMSYSVTIGIDTMRVKLRESNTDAALFYQHQGFVLKDCLDAYYRNGETALELECKIDKKRKALF